MNPRARVSVVVPVYNAAPYLARCVESVLAQTLGDIEVVIVDDGSTDRSRDVAERYARQDKRIRVLRHPQNLGLHLARISGASASSGEYVGYVDSDDYVSEEMFGHLYDEAKRADADIARTGAWIRRPGLADAPRALTFDECCYQTGIAYLDTAFHPAMWLHLHRRRLWPMVLADLPRIRLLGEDNLTSFILSFVAGRVVSLSSVMYNYVERNDSLSGDSSVDNVVRHAVDRASMVRLLKSFIDRHGGHAASCWSRIKASNRDLVFFYIGTLADEAERQRAIDMFELAWEEQVPSAARAAWPSRVGA
jgi:glycosyltransferase involved in cell wall biosynthesis